MVQYHLLQTVHTYQTITFNTVRSPHMYSYLYARVCIRLLKRLLSLIN